MFRTTGPYARSSLFVLFALLSGCGGSKQNTADTTAPTVSVPADITVEASVPNGAPATDPAIVAFLSGASGDDAGGIASEVNDAPSLFPLGTTVVTFSFTDNAGNTGTGSASVTVEDTTPPVIQLNGPSPFILSLGTAFTDPVTATDIADDNLTIDITGTVDIDVAGSYTLTYNVTDASGNTATTMIREVIVNTPPTARKALTSVDTSTNGIEIPAAGNSLDLSASDDFTLAMWVKPSALTDGMVFYSQETAAVGSHRFLVSGSATGGIRFSSDNFGSGLDTFSSTDVLAVGQWSFIAVTRTGNTVRLYHNGILVGQGTQITSAGATTGTGAHYIGKFGDNPDPAADAEISHVSVWNSALSSSRIMALMPQYLQGTETGLIAYWPLDEGTGTTANDLVGSNPGNLLTGASWTAPDSPIDRIVAAPGSNAVITLAGSDADTNVMALHITGLPTNGSLFQSDGTTPVAAGDTVSDSSNLSTPSGTAITGRVVYRSTNGGNDRFTFVAHDLDAAGVDSSPVTVDISDSTPPVAAAGTALQFTSAENDVVVVPDSTSLDDAVDNVSVELWFRATTNDSNGGTTLLEKGGPFHTYPYTLRLTATNGIGTITFATFDGRWVPVINSSPFALNDGEWHHVAGVRGGGNQFMRLYVDGQLQGELTAADNTALANLNLGNITNNQPLSFGNTTVTPLTPFQGELDEVRVWNSARSQAEIQADMNKTLTGSEAGLVGYWRFDEGSGSLVRDLSTNANDGVLGSGGTADMPLWTAAGNPQFNPGTVAAPADGSDRAIYIGGADVDGDALSTRITSLPSQGSLFQADGVTPINAGDTVTDAQGQVIFRSTVAGQDAFEFVVNDGTSDSAAVAVSVDVQ